MLRFLEALNPCHFCFSVADFEDALIEIQIILKNFNSISNDKENDPLAFEEKERSLEKAFRLALLCLNASNTTKPDKQLSYLLADLLRQYGTLCYNENYFASKQILILALNLHLYTIGIFNECINVHEFASLDDLKKQCRTKPLLFFAFEQSILSTNIDRSMALAYTHSFMQSSSKKQMFSLAETCRWLGYCYQNIDETSHINPENELRFSQLFQLSESLHLLNLEITDDKAGKLSLADLYFQAWPFQHQRKNPSDLNGTCHLYDQALIYDSSQEMQARIANRRFLLLFSNGLKAEALSFLKKAISLAEGLDEGKHGFLLSCLYDSFAGYWMEPETLDLDQAGLYLEKIAKYAAENRFKGRDHLQFALYDIRFAEFKFVKGEFAAAGEAIERSLTTLRKYPESQQSHLYQAEALKSLIAKAFAETRRNS